MTRNGLKGWKIDTGKEGTRIIFRDYHKAIIDVLLLDPEVSWSSGEMHERMKAKGIKISRASVIFYMNFLVDDGLATYTDATGKGGHHKLYRIPNDWEGVKDHIVEKVIKGLGEALDETPFQVIMRLT